MTTTLIDTNGLHLETQIHNRQLDFYDLRRSKLGINEFNIDDPYSRILRLFYEKSTSTFNEIFNEFKKYGNRLISLSSDFNIYIDNPNRKKSILKQVKIEIENLQKLCNSQELIKNNTDYRYKDLVDLSFDEIRQEFNLFSEDDITNKNNGLNDFQEKWSARISDFENIRNKSTNHVVTSTNEKSILNGYLGYWFPNLITTSENKSKKSDVKYIKSAQNLNKTNNDQEILLLKNKINDLNNELKRKDDIIKEKCELISNLTKNINLEKINDCDTKENDNIYNSSGLEAIN